MAGKLEAPATFHIDNGETMPAICGLLACYDNTKGTISTLLKRKISSMGGPAVDDDEVRALIMACAGLAYTDDNGRGFDYRKYVRGLIRFIQVKSSESGYKFKRVEPAVSVGSPFPAAANLCKLNVTHYMFKAATVASDSSVAPFVAAQIIEAEFNAAYRNYTEDDLKDIFPEAPQAAPAAAPQAAPALDPIAHIATAGVQADMRRAAPQGHMDPQVNHSPAYPFGWAHGSDASFGRPAPFPNYQSFGAYFGGPSVPFAMGCPPPMFGTYGYPNGPYPMTTAVCNLPTVTTEVTTPARLVPQQITEPASRKREVTECVGVHDPEIRTVRRKHEDANKISTQTSYAARSTNTARPNGKQGIMLTDHTHQQPFVPPVPEIQQQTSLPQQSFFPMIPSQQPQQISTSSEIGNRLSNFVLNPNKGASKRNDDDMLASVPSTTANSWSMRNRRGNVKPSKSDSVSDNTDEEVIEPFADPIGDGWRDPFSTPGHDDDNTDKTDQSARFCIAVVAVFGSCSGTFTGAMFILMVCLGVLCDCVVLLCWVIEFLGLVFYYSTYGDPNAPRNINPKDKKLLIDARLKEATDDFQLKQEATMARFGRRFLSNPPAPTRRILCD